MFLDIIIVYLTFGLLINFIISEIDKIHLYDDVYKSDEGINPHLIILLWPILIFSIGYYLIKEILKQES